MIYKKKGSIVPSWLIRMVEKKSQHQLKFGCDVCIDGYTIQATPNFNGCVIYDPSRRYCNLKQNKGLNKKLVQGWISNPRTEIRFLTPETE